MNHKTIPLFIILTLLSTLSFAQPGWRLKQIGDSLQEKRKFPEAIVYYKKALKLNPLGDSIPRAIGFSYLENQQYDSGKRYYELALKYNPSCAPCHYHLSRTEIIKGNFSEALKHSETAISIDPQKSVYYYQRGIIRRNMNYSIMALLDFDKAISMDPKIVEFYIERGSYHFDNGDLSSSLRDADSIVRLAPDYFYGYNLRALIQFQKKDYKSAYASYLRALQLDSQNAMLYMNIGELLLNMDSLKEAIVYLDEFIRREPGQPQGYYYRAEAKNALEDMDGGCADFIKANKILIAAKRADWAAQLQSTERAITDRCDSSKAGYYYQRGIAAYNLGKYQDAVKFYERGLKKFPKSGMILQFMGNAYVALQMDSMAVIYYKRFLSDLPSYSKELEEQPLIVSKGKAYRDNYFYGSITTTNQSIAKIEFRAGRYDSALRYIDLAMKNMDRMFDYPKATLYYDRALILLHMNRNELARKEIEKAILIDPKYAEAYLCRALCFIESASGLSSRRVMLSSSIQGMPTGGQYSFPVRKASADNQSYQKALEDLDKAIGLQPNFAYAYCLRGYVKMQLKHDDYCLDYKMTEYLGFPVDPEWKKDCR